VPKTLLAVDDSATMRKVLEITFSGEDFRVVTAHDTQSALARMSDEPNVVVIDTVLDGEDGYAVAKQIRQRDARATIVLLSSRYHPYDANRGRDAGADDYADKPFDTQQMIDKVRKAMLAREQTAAAAPPAQPAFRAPAPAPTPAPPIAAAAAPVPQTAPSSFNPMQTPRQAPPAPTPPKTGRAPTLAFEGGPPAFVPPAPAPPAPPPHAAAPPAPAPRVPVLDHAPPPRPAPPVPVAKSPDLASATNGHLAGKLAELGLTPAQADAVLALSREVVERVVWEVVPQLAEAIIKEEIARLTKEG
jgi:CheY-like chemotaxis protein